MQTCSPKPKARWVGRCGRVTSNRSAVGPEDGLVPVGRGVQEHHELALGHRRAGHSMSTAAVRPKAWMGVTQRSISSTAPTARTRVPEQPGPLVGMAGQRLDPARHKVRVVSLPATSRVRQKPMISVRSRGRPSSEHDRQQRSTGRWTRSSASRCGPSGTRPSGPARSARSSSVRSVLSMTASDHRRKRARSDTGTPNISAITAMGMGAATASTKSTVRSVGTASRTSVHHLADPLLAGGPPPAG